MPHKIPTGSNPVGIRWLHQRCRREHTLNVIKIATMRNGEPQ